MEKLQKLLLDEQNYMQALLKMMEEKREEMSFEKWQSYYSSAYRSACRIAMIEEDMALLILEKEILSLNKTIAA
jgi:hypothetical protein